MTDRKQALTALLEKVEAGDRDGLCFVMARNGWPSEPFPPDYASRIDAAYQGSLDAAKALHEAVLPRRYWNLSEWDGAWSCQIPVSTFKRYEATSEHSPARAWLIAILKALIARERDT